MTMWIEVLLWLALPVQANAAPTPAVQAPIADNAAMTEMFEADQAARQNPTPQDWNRIATDDAERRSATKALLDAGALKTGRDFWHAAFIFQHGGEAADYLLAHSLAMVAAGRGHEEATWIAAATLDRYLQTIGQKQIYGTQFNWRSGQPVTQEPYDRALISDALRQALGVPTLSEQGKRRDMLEAQRPDPLPAARPPETNAGSATGSKPTER